MENFEQYPPRLRMLLTQVAQTEFGSLILDPEKGNRKVYEILTHAEDPILREIGSQLRDGTASPREIANSAHYRDALERGIANLEHLDLDRIEKEVDLALDNSPDDSRGCERSRDPLGSSQTTSNTRKSPRDSLGECRC